MKSDPMNIKTWQTKLHARLHDPAEKALVLLRDPLGHEGGTVRRLHSLLFKDELSEEIRRWVQMADWWSSAADRPQWPVEKVVRPNRDGEATTRIVDWARVNWAKQPILIHPLSGREISLGSLAATDLGEIKDRSREHLENLIVRNGPDIDWRKTLLAFWRFGPELIETEDNSKLGALWPLLPADTRVPDHSIWDHLDLTSAFAGAFAADDNGKAALLTLSIGPVQPFIAAARTTSDLWAGSHLLARLSWEAMRVVCERLGPDAILFPRLRGIPQVDVWLRDECGLPKEWFDSCHWAKSATDSNPLFAAALPNRFVAIVPASHAANLGKEVRERVRMRLQSLGGKVVDQLLEAAKYREKGEERDESIHAYRQMREQLENFPEVHWAAVPFSLIRARGEKKQRDLDVSQLSGVMAPFFGKEGEIESGFLDSAAWKVLQNDIKWDDNTTFWSPNPGVLYPAVYDLAERTQAAAKAVRPFEQVEQTGWRCSLTGETEWLTTDPDQLRESYRGRDDTLWAKIAEHQLAWAKKGEHLGALSAIKRLWPSLFSKEVAKVVNTGESARFVVSTHTFALAHQLDHWVKAGKPLSDSLLTELDERGIGNVALPRRMVRAGCEKKLQSAKRLPALLDSVRESGNEAERKDIERRVREELGATGLETYYALILLDGDHMGKILSGTHTQCAITYRESFHPSVQKGFDKRAEHNSAIDNYGKQRRAISPNRHLAISASLNDFAMRVVPHIVEREHLGRVIYAGGDDVMAMLPVADLLSTMGRLREAYSGGSADASSGVLAESDFTDWRKSSVSDGKLSCRNGFVLLPDGKGSSGLLMRMMGGATASCGAVIAHYQTPLAAALRELRAAENRAKNEGDRDAFSISVLKRSGGDLRFTDKWVSENGGSSLLDLMDKTRRFLANPEVSRRAVYHSLVWLRDLPAEPGEEMLGDLLGYQLSRQVAGAAGKLGEEARELAVSLASHSLRKKKKKPTVWLTGFLSIAEFIAREVRSPGGAGAVKENAA